MEDFSQVEWPNLWEATTNQGLERQLRREISEQHVLYRVKVIPIARRVDNDDVLFAVLDEAKPPLALVHLTWSGKKETDPGFDSAFPWTNFFNSLEEVFASVES